MREIKFRAWNKLAGMLDVTQVGVGDTKSVLVWKNGMASTSHRLAHGQYELMQFTGLTDKNGKEIYEGDIVKTTDGVRCVRWIPGSFRAFDRISGDDKEDHPIFFFRDHGEIIGNIYENPDLLTV